MTTLTPRCPAPSPPPAFSCSLAVSVCTPDRRSADEISVWSWEPLPGKRCRQQEVNSAFRQIFGLQGVTVLFGASGGGGCAGGGPGSSK